MIVHNQLSADIKADFKRKNLFGDSGRNKIIVIAARFDYSSDCRNKTMQAREMCYKTFNELQLESIPSVTSFVMFNVDKIGAGFSKQLQEKNIMVQYREHFGSKWCRVSMGTIEEMQLFCNALKSIG